MKLRLGGETSPKAEVARLRTVRDVVGEGVDLMVDINQGWDVNRTIAVGRGMAEYNIFWLEDPVHFQDYIGLARIADALDTPIAAGGIPLRHRTVPPHAGSWLNRHRHGGSSDRGRHHTVDEGCAPGGGV